MNDAHLHLVVNHFPIIGTIFGVGILIAGRLLKNNAIKNVSYVIFIVAAIFAFISMSTGEGAEELVEDMPAIGKQIIHEHEEVANNLAYVLYTLAILSLLGLYTNIKNHRKADLFSFLIFIVSLLAVFFAQHVGTSGGEIRHTEIRNNTPQTQSNETEDDD
ncbi:hypothetical protein [Flavobacterium sangjuense]|uniref:DUF2231 domain-containing protein n=1 Tax=Flavobacterium sangjuense TaxID=2518177 RepID=A0A4P7PVP1_9FLAO|nr:hypothetical protein [Flavobacterium sangjuense]QBZ98450.1 hypothetical protein GS03_01955 [Flavobacterium sangjuense]